GRCRADPRGRGPPRVPRGATPPAPPLLRSPWRRTLAIAPVVGFADPSQPLAGFSVAESAGETGLEGGARRDSERGGSFVVAGQVGVEHGRVVGRDRAADACGDELWQRMLLEGAHDSGADVGEWTNVEHRSAPRQLGHETGVLDRADAVP